jgi:hypothetical protein
MIIIKDKSYFKILNYKNKKYKKEQLWTII